MAGKKSEANGSKNTNQGMHADSSLGTGRGYDSALRLKQDDDLGRWRFAAEIAEVIRSTPPEWSARIGIFGKWGEGKSTILHFLDSMLRSEENIIFTFNPWAVQDLNEMWAEFGTDLIQALGSAGILVEPPWKRFTRSAQDKLGGLKDVAEGAAALAGKDQLVKSTFGLVGNWLKPDGAQVKKIRAKIGGKRIIVFIDDLDRATPELLPKLLLALRELLDLPGFSFVLAFDDEIVANGLKSVNTAWEEGASFLDKILDFRFYLPRVSERGKLQLLERMLSQYCSFVPPESIAPIETLIPENPRKLKTLIRGMISLKTQVDRHRPDELDWPTIWLAEMVRRESHAFFLRLLEGETLSDLAGIGYQISASGLRRSGAQDAPDDSDIERLIKEVGGISKSQTGRLKDLIKATRSVAGTNLLYNWRFSFCPEPITWKEFEGAVALWNSDRRPEVITEWIAQQARTTSIGVHRIEQDFFQTLINARQQALSEAASSSSADDHRKHIGKASEHLAMITQFLCLPKMVTAERFELLYGQAQYWIGFQMNDDDKMTRQEEKTVLDSTIRQAPVEVIPGILKGLAPWDPWAITPDVENTMALKKDLRDDLVKLVLPAMEQAVVEALNQSKFSTLVQGRGMDSFAYILMNPRSLPWPEPIRQAMIAIAKGAKSDSFRYEQVNDLLRLFLDIINDRTLNLSIDQLKAILGDQEFASSLWAGATSRAIQFHMLNLFLAYRSALVTAGVAEGNLPLTPELRAAAARAEIEAHASDAAKSQPAAKVGVEEEVDEDLEELGDEGDLT